MCFDFHKNYYEIQKKNSMTTMYIQFPSQWTIDKTFELICRQNVCSIKGKRNKLYCEYIMSFSQCSLFKIERTKPVSASLNS